MKRKLEMGVSAATVLFGLITTGQAAVIDNFNDGTVAPVSGPTGPTLQTGLGANTLDGNRTYGIDNNPGATLEINDGLPFDTTGRLSFSNDGGTDGTLTLTYTGLSVDLTDGGASNSIVFEFLSADQPATVTVMVTDGDSTDTQNLSIPASVSPQTIPHFFSVFTAIDFTDVNAVTITLSPNNTNGGDYLLDIIESRDSNIPEPASMALLTLGGLAMIQRRRRA